eukprot:scaffold95511_cov20-Tisochrysis_lutea.AAC.1
MLLLICNEKCILPPNNLASCNVLAFVLLQILHTFRSQNLPYSQVERVMRALHVRKLHLWPRFQSDVAAAMELTPPESYTFQSDVAAAMELTPPEAIWHSTLSWSVVAAAMHVVVSEVIVHPACSKIAGAADNMGEAVRQSGKKGQRGYFKFFPGSKEEISTSL